MGKKKRVRKLIASLTPASGWAFHTHSGEAAKPGLAGYTTATAVTSINCSGRPNIWCMDTPVADGKRSPKYTRRTAPTFR